MEKNDLYLSDEQIEQIAGECANKSHEEFVYAGKIVSKASADYAVKKVIEWLEAEQGNCDMGMRLAQFERSLEALKKLIET